MNENNSPSDVKPSGQWSHAYYSLLVLSVILISVLTCLAYVALDISDITINSVPIFEEMALPGLTAFYVSVGTGGLVIIAAVIEFIIVALVFFRHHMFSVLFCGVLIIMCVLFMAVAQIAMLLPYLKYAPVL